MHEGWNAVNRPESCRLNFYLGLIRNQAPDLRACPVISDVTRTSDVIRTSGVATDGQRDRRAEGYNSSLAGSYAL